MASNARLNNAISTDAAPTLLPVFSQAIKTKDMIYVSGNIGVLPKTNELVSGVKEQTVRRFSHDQPRFGTPMLTNPSTTRNKSSHTSAPFSKPRDQTWAKS